jgi:two-component system chemotaxis response regulator CheB
MAHLPIRVLLVDHSFQALETLKRLLALSAEIEVVGTARNAKEALALIPNLQPQVICTGMQIPQLNGLDLIQQVMAKHPRPILVLVTSAQQKDTRMTFEMLKAGAVDILLKSHELASTHAPGGQELINKIKILSGVTVFTRHQREPLPSPKVQLGLQSSIAEQTITSTTTKVVAIGASTGGPEALRTILTQLPLNFPVPIICIQHISEGFLQGLVDWLASECQLPIKIAQTIELPLPGTIYFASEKTHLELDSQGRFTYSLSPPVEGHRPSVTVTFKSIANFYGKAAVGILLTGMGRDGVEGMQAIAQAGGITIAQDEKSSVVFGMPKEVIALGAVQHILPASDIAGLLLTKIFFNQP